MNIFQPDTLLLVILFFVPGFVTMKVYDILVPNISRNSTAYVFDAVAYSTINFAISLCFLIPLYLAHYHILSIIAFLFALLILPILIALIAVKSLKSEFIKKYASGLTARPWDIVFDKNKGYWVVVHLRNGEKVLGIFDIHSAASRRPNEEQLYLECVATTQDDGTFVPIEGSQGVLIMGREIVLIELFDLTDNLLT